MVTKEAPLPRETYYQSLVHRLYDDFDQVTGIKTSPAERLNRAYHPVLERAKIVMAWLENGYDSKNLKGLHRDVENNILTTLAERYNVRGATGHYDLINNHLWSPDFPNEPFIDAIKRGVILRANLGSEDSKREQEEILGWQKITNELLNAPFGTRIISLSPPGKSYKEHYIDEFVLESPTRVHRKRSAVDFTPEDYEAFALAANPHYFAGHHPEVPEDAWFLGHPFKSTQQIPPHRIAGYPVEKFEIIASCSDKLRAAHAASLFRENIDWQEVISTANTMFAYADKIKVDLEIHNQPQVTRSSRLSLLQLDMLASEPIRMVGGGCGSSGGFEFGKNILLKNSAAKTGAKENDENYTTGCCESCKHYGTVGRCSNKCIPCEDKEHPEVHFTRN